MSVEDRNLRIFTKLEMKRQTVLRWKKCGWLYFPQRRPDWALVEITSKRGTHLNSKTRWSRQKYDFSKGFFDVAAFDVLIMSDMRSKKHLKKKKKSTKLDLAHSLKTESLASCLQCPRVQPICMCPNAHALPTHLKFPRSLSFP